jgi:hypothetical protein
MPVMRLGSLASAARAVDIYSGELRAAADAVAAVDGERVAVARRGGAEEGEEGLEVRADLSGRPRPAADRDTAAGDERGDKERRGVGEVGLDVDVDAADLRGGHYPHSGLGALDHDASRGESGDGHLDVRHARQFLARVAQGEALGETRRGEQQAGDELARRRSVDRQLSARDGPGAVQAERKRAAAVVVDVDAEVAQRVDGRAHRAAARALVAVERDRSEGEGRDRRQETHDGAGEAALD